MSGDLLFLTARTARNRVASRLGRLRQPKYLAFAVIGGAFFWLLAGRHWLEGWRLAAEAGDRAVPPGLLEAAAALLVFMSLALAWCAPPPVSALAFTDTEIHALFPAPIARRRLVRWKLLTGEAGVLISALVAAAVAGPHLAGGHRLLFTLGLALAMTTIHLHLAWIRMARHALHRRGLGWGARCALVVLLILAFAGTSAWWIRRQAGPLPLDAIGDPGGVEALGAWVANATASGPLLVVTWPVRLLVGPALAADPAGFVRALPPALALLLISYAWSLRAGTRVAHDTGVSLTPRQGRTPHRLAERGRPVAALVWKRAVALRRSPAGIRGLLLVLLVAGLFPGGMLLAHGRQASLAAGITWALLAMALPLLAVPLTGIDFRREMSHIDRLKSWPLEGRGIILGSIVLTVGILTVAEWILLGAAALVMTAGPGAPAAAGRSWVLVAAAAGAMVAPPLNMLVVLVHNAAVLMFPAWAGADGARAPDIESVGQGTILTICLAGVVVAGSLPAAAVGMTTWLAATPLAGSRIGLIVAAVPAALTLAAESWVGIRLLGARLDRLDISAELDVTG